MSQTLKVKEIFYSIQGEGARTGEASIFIRLAGCNMHCSFCDTDHSNGTIMRLPDILGTINKYPCQWIVWTGGEPCLQLTTEIVDWFRMYGKYKQAIETNGSVQPPFGLDYIACSPKVQPEVLHKSFIYHKVDEFRYPVNHASDIPDINQLPRAKHYFLSPLFIGEPKKKLEIDIGNVNYVQQQVKRNPKWKLSIQIHKLIKIQ